MAKKNVDPTVSNNIDVKAGLTNEIQEKLDQNSEELFREVAASNMKSLEEIIGKELVNITHPSVTDYSDTLPSKVSVAKGSVEFIWQDPRLADDWTEQVISVLREGEVIDGKPTTKGLRRFIRTVFRVVSSTTQLGACVGMPGRTIDDSMRGASAMHIIKLITPDGITEEWGGAADAFYDNLDGKFRKYPTAMADTRAEGRALVRALNLKCVTYDEIQGNDDSDKEPANDAQWDRFNKDFEKFDINAGAFFNAHKEELKYPRAAALTHGQVVELFGKLNVFKQGKEVPQEWRGYDARWRKVVKGSK